MVETYAYIYSKGKPCTPPIVNGITFEQTDVIHDIWCGRGIAADVAAMVTTGQPFYTDAELSGFASSAAGHVIAKTAHDAAVAASGTAAGTLGLLQVDLTAAIFALANANEAYDVASADLDAKTALLATATAAAAADPEDTDLAAAVVAAQAVVDTATTALGAADTAVGLAITAKDDAQAAYDAGVTTAAASAATEAAALDTLSSAALLLGSVNGKVNPYA